VARRFRPIEVAGLACVLVLAGALYIRSLHAAANYDEGVYLASVDALEHGQSLGTDVYASQPPGFYVLLRGISLLPGDGVAAIRVAFILLALVGLGAGYAIGRKLTGVWGGLGAALLLAVTAPYPVQAARVQADTASVALALAAVAVLVYADRRPWPTAAAGALAGAAVSVKLLALPVVAPLVVLLVARRSWRAAAALAAGAGVVWIALAGAYAGALGKLWTSVVTDHRRARALGPSITDNLHRVLVHPLDWKTPAAVLVVAGLVCAAVWLRRVEMLALAAWIVVSAAFLVYQRPLLDHHLVLLATVLAVPAGAGLGAAVVSAPHRARVAVAAVVAVALALGFVQEHDRLADQDGDPPGVTWAAAQLRTLTQPQDLVATDLPIVAYRADRRVPGQLIDSSFVRLRGGSLTYTDVLGTLVRQKVRTVVVGRLYAEDPHLMVALRTAFLDKWVERDGVKIFHAP
jgi:Glycosyltransferase family 87